MPPVRATPALPAEAMPPGSITVVMPVLDEGATLSTCLERLRAMAPEVELVLVDGGSKDQSAALAASYGKVLHTRRGRAWQLNAGAEAAGGEWLLFLHADTSLPLEYAEALTEAQRRGRQAGVYSLRIRGRHPLLPWLSFGANLRSRLRRVFLGDQALFIRKTLFEELGGFPEQPLLEDYTFALLLKKKRIPIHVSSLRVETSGRRWDQGGFFCTWWQFRRIFLRYHLFGDSTRHAQTYSPIR